MKLALYFGYGDGGHFLRSHGTSLGGRYRKSTLDPQRDFPGFPWEIGLLDTGLLKNRRVPDVPDGRVHWTCGGHPEFWHAFFWWDRSGDKRPASNSGFYVAGFPWTSKENLDVERKQAFAFACEQWPEVVKRQHFALALEAWP